MRTEQFATLVGVDRVDVIGRKLSELVPPEYAELVSENIRRRLAGEAAAERYEIEMAGVQGLDQPPRDHLDDHRLRRRACAADHGRRDRSDPDRSRITCVTVAGRRGQCGESSSSVRPRFAR